MATQIDPVPSARERHAPPAPRLASQRVRPDLDNAVVFVAGKDPLEETGGGHSTLLRAHGRAALRAGFVPHLFGVGRSVGVVETDYGVVHRLRSPFWRLRQLPGVGFRTHMAVWHAPLISRSVERFVMAGPRPRLIHGFGVWGAAAVTASRRLGRRGIPIAPIVSAYTSMEHEVRAKLRGLRASHGRLPRIRLGAELLWMQWLLARHEREAYLGARLVLINYESVREILRARWGEGIPFRKLPYASEAAFLHEKPEAAPPAPPGLAGLRPLDAPLVVAVSRHDPRKGLDVLIHALARLRAAGVRFRACLVGSGAFLDAHRRLARRLGLGAETAIEGFVPDPYPYLQHADVFALPSLEEGSGSLSLLEALQAGVGVVASGVDGIPEDVTDGDSALLVSPGDAEGLAVALERVLTDPELRRRLARRARETFEARFSAGALADALKDVYAELGFESGRG